MKKIVTIAMSALLILGLTACGGSGNSGGETADVDLESFYAGLAEEYGWTEDVEGITDDQLLLSTIEGEMLESYYPGLSEIPSKQLVAKAPTMSSVVNEVVFLQCETEEDAEKAAEIFQARIDYQVGDETNPGGAWYPESIESWKQAQVVREGTYAALIAVTNNGAEIAEAFTQQFQ